MADEFGAYLAGPNLVLRPDTDAGGLILTGSAPADSAAIKTHAGYTGSTSIKKSFAVSTVDATVTVIASIAVPSNYAVAINALVLGKQDDETDAIAATAVGCAVNAAGTTALKGTPLYQVVESAAGTDVTITADDATDTIRVNVTGVATQNWAWVCTVEYMFVDTSA